MLASEQVMRSITAMQALPLCQTAWMEGLAYRTWIAEVTGLSKALVYRGGLGTLRPSKQIQIREYARKRVLKRAQRGGWPEADFLSYEKRILALQAQGGAGWTMFATSIDNPSHPILQASVNLAVKLDLDLEALRCLAAETDLNAYCSLGAHLVATHDQSSESSKDSMAWANASTWEEIELPTKQLLDAYWLDLHACLDAEWANRFFPTMAPVPVFPFIWPIGDIAIVERGEPWMNFKKTLRRPTRRFLQFIYAMQYRSSHRVWPACAPGATELARALGEDPKTVTKYFATTNLRASSAEGAWEKMSQHFHQEIIGGYPVVLATLAVCWQQIFLEVSASKLKSVIIPDKAAYTVAWERHRAKLADQGSGLEPWPPWLTA